MFLWNSINIKIIVLRCSTSVLKRNSKTSNKCYFEPSWPKNNQHHWSWVGHVKIKVIFGWNNKSISQTLVLLRLIQRQSRLFLTQPLTIFYPLKDSNNLFFKKTLFFHMQFIESFQINFFFVFPGTLNFQSLVIVVF